MTSFPVIAQPASILSASPVSAFFARASSPTGARIGAPAALLLLLLPATAAFAVSGNVRSACMSDYFAYCRAHSVGSPALRACMKANGPRLSKSCVTALIGAGEISPGYVSKRKALAGAN